MLSSMEALRKGKKKLPKGWRWEKLKALGKLSQGGTPSTDIPEYWGGSIPFITGADITNLYVSKGRSYLSEKGFESGKTQQCNPGDLLIVSRTRVGRVGIAKTKLGISQDVSVLEVNKGQDVKYLAMFLNSISSRLEEGCQGSTIKGLTRDFVENIVIPLPPTLDQQISVANELQRKIAEVDKIREAAQRQKEAFAAMQAAILREVFPYNEGDKLPVGWKWKQLDEICFINASKSKDFARNPNDQTSFVPMDAVDELAGCISKRITRPYSEISKGYTYFEEGDVLFAKITPCMQNGKSAIAEGLIDGVGFGSTEFHVFRPKPGLIKEWIYFFLRTKEFRKKAEDHFEGSAGQQRVPAAFLKAKLIPLPATIDLQIEIVTALKRKMKIAENIYNVADLQLEAIKSLPRAFLREIFDFEEE